jgi:hypothetical protein
VPGDRFLKRINENVVDKAMSKKAVKDLSSCIALSSFLNKGDILRIRLANCSCAVWRVPVELEGFFRMICPDKVACANPFRSLVGGHHIAKPVAVNHVGIRSQVPFTG